MRTQYESALNSLSEAAKKYESVLEALQKLAGKGDIEAQTLLGKAYFDGIGDKYISISDSVEWLTGAANNGSRAAQHLLSQFYLTCADGWQDVPNYGRHLYWLQKSAESGHLEALFDLAGYHAEGFRNIEKDINRALELYDSIRSEFPRAEEMYQVYSHELKLPGQKSS